MRASEAPGTDRASSGTRGVDHGPFPAPVHVPEGGVRVTRTRLTIPCYAPAPAEVLPLFLNRRVYQGSCGKVFPLHVVERVADAPVPTPFDAVILENEHVQVVVLPALGGRVHRLYDKAAAYDVIYRCAMRVV